MLFCVTVKLQRTQHEFNGPFSGRQPEQGDRVSLRNVGTFLHLAAAVFPSICHWTLSPRKLQNTLWDVQGKGTSLGT